MATDKTPVETADAQPGAVENADAAPQVVPAGPIPVDPRTAAETPEVAAGNVQPAEKVAPEEVNIPGVDGVAPTAAYGTHPDQDSPRPVGIVAPEHQALRENAEKNLPPEGEVRPAAVPAEETKPV